MAWRDRGSNDSKHDMHDSNGKHDSSGEVERRAADILRRLGADRGSDSEVVDRFMKRVDERAKDIKDEDSGNGKRGWW